MARPRTSLRSCLAFTLVELLVVIGIIAILVGILLPALSSARRSAQAAKCAASLREIGNVFKLYASDNKNYYPPMRCASNYQVMFNSAPPVMYNTSQTYWMYFLAKYVSHAKFGNVSGTTPADVARSMNTILWGCPTFVPVETSIASELPVGGISTVYTGYGMNGFPEYTPTWPPASWSDPYAALGDGLTPQPPNDWRAVSSVNCTGGNWSVLTAGRWYKMTQYTQPAERALVGDCRAYVLEALKATSNTSFAGQADIVSIGAGTFWVGAPDPAQSSYDYYRHGKYPPRMSSNQYSPNGGKIAYNVLFADGHVQMLNTREEGFKAARMRFPG